MQKFLIAVFSIALIFCATLYFRFHYELTPLTLHLGVVSILSSGVFGLWKLAGLIGSKSLRAASQSVITCSFFFLLISFYVVTIISNFFWGQPIDFRLFIFYLSSLPSLIASLPVGSWILYGGLSALILLILFLFVTIKPASAPSNKKSVQKSLFIILPALFSSVLFYPSLLGVKRYLQYEGEPITGFIFIQNFTTPEKKRQFGSMILENSHQDQACIEKVKKEGVNGAQQNVVIIVLDALRRDFLSAYGYPKETTPFLDSMLREKAMKKVDYPFSPATATLPGVFSLFSSKGFDKFNFSGLTLMKFMKMKGYTTYTFLTGRHLLWYGLANIYKKETDHFYQSGFGMQFNDDDLITLNQIEKTRLEKPFFAYIHLESTHTIGTVNEQYRRYKPDMITFGVSKKEALVNKYQNGILEADGIVRKFFEKLKSADLLKNTTVIIVSDHDDLFGEDGRWHHSGSVHPYLQTIPMIIYDQKLDWYRNTYSASLLDIAPTIADRLGYQPPECWTGTSLHQNPKIFLCNSKAPKSASFLMASSRIKIPC